MPRLPLIVALCSTMALSACGKSELDDKPSAEVKDPKDKDAKDTKKDPEAKADDGAEEPAGDAKTVQLDAATSSVGFVGAKVTADHEGSFGTISGSATLEGGKSPSKIEVSVKVDSLTIEPPDLQKHLLSADFFDAEKFGEAKFVSSELREKAGEGGATHEIEGDLTLHGVTKTIVFPAKVEVSDTEAKGSAEFKINRKDFGIEYPGMPDDLIKDEVLLKLSLVYPLG